MSDHPDVPVIDLGVGDKKGTPLSTGDRVIVTGSDRFGEGLGVVIGYAKMHAIDCKVVDGKLKTLAEQSQIRIRVLMDNGTGGDDYSASQGRVEKLGDPTEAFADALKKAAPDPDPADVNDG